MTPSEAGNMDSMNCFCCCFGPRFFSTEVGQGKNTSAAEEDITCLNPTSYGKLLPNLEPQPKPKTGVATYRCL